MDSYTAANQVAYILPQGVQRPKGRKSGRNVRQPGEGGFVLVGMGESLGKVFTTAGAAAKYATSQGFKLNPFRVPRPS
jgi:hypothetical protein